MNNSGNNDADLEDEPESEEETRVSPVGIYLYYIVLYQYCDNYLLYLL
jgi:hypothetical protein